MAKPRKILWITDPWATLDHPNDTSLRLAQGAIELGHTNHWCDVKTIRLENSRVTFDAQKIESARDPRSSSDFKLSKTRALDFKSFDQIHYRTDPPIDLAYLQPLQLISLGTEGSKVEVVNPLNVLFRRNEKFEASALSAFAPKCIVTSSWEHLLSFGKREKKTVLKPLHDAQSKGVELLSWRNDADVRTSRQKLIRLTAGFKNPVILQRFLPEIAEGEKRLWFIDGKLLAWIRKLPLQGDFRVNLDLGSQLARTELNAKDRRAAAAISKRLKSTGIRLAAVDLIEGQIIDFNFTSPGLISQMEKILSANLVEPIIRALTRQN